MKIDEEVRNIILDWSKKTGIKVSFTKKGIRLHKKLERKGAYVMELDDLNYDLPIINKALVDYMMKGISIEETINNCNLIKEFQKIVKISSNYEGGWHNGKYLTDKTFRVFASNDQNDSYLGKYKYKGATIEKFANTPEHSFIMNENVNGVLVTKKLDKQWYIDLAKKRLDDFGIKINKEIGGLF